MRVARRAARKRVGGGANGLGVFGRFGQAHLPAPNSSFRRLTGARSRPSPLSWPADDYEACDVANCPANARHSGGERAIGARMAPGRLGLEIVPQDV